MTRRASSLPIAQFCARAVELNEKYAAGRAASMGSAFHALAAAPTAPETHALLEKLTWAERVQIDSWKVPEPLVLRELATRLEYKDAVKEQPLGLTADGTPCGYTDPQALITGTLDMAWTVDAGLDRWAVVGDIKSRRTTSVPDSLQLHAYAYAYAQLQRCDYYLTAIWAAADGCWLMGDTVEMATQGSAVWGRLKAAATNLEVSTGPHCEGCYQRLRCKDYLLPAIVTQDTPDAYRALLADPSDMTGEEALAAYKLLKRRREVDEQAEGVLKAWADANGGIVDGNKVWLASFSEGRQSIDTKSLAKDYPNIAEKYTKNGAPFKTYRWVKK